jgi:DNA polymerase III beta subunit-like protein
MTTTSDSDTTKVNGSAALPAPIAGTTPGKSATGAAGPGTDKTPKPEKGTREKFVTEVGGPTVKPTPKPKAVGKMETVEVNIDLMLAALMCVATDETRYYLQGVYLHRTKDGFVRAVATDGHRAIICTLYREAKDKPGAKWLGQGIIIPAEGLGNRLKLIAKEHGDMEHLGARISYGENQPRIELADAMGANVFRLTPIDGTFPDYERVTTQNWSGVGVERSDWKPTGFDPAYLKAVGDIAKRLGTESVQCFDYAKEDGSDQPVLFTFGKVDNVVLFLMPTRADPKMAEAARLMLAPSIKLTIAALRAHETRNKDAAKDLTGEAKEAALAKAEDFAKRIKQVLENAGSGQVQAALPAPKPEKPKKKPTVAEWAKEKAATDKAAKQAHKASVEAARAKAKAAKPHNAVVGIVNAMARGAGVKAKPKAAPKKAAAKKHA